MSGKNGNNKKRYSLKRFLNRFLVKTVNRINFVSLAGKIARSEKNSTLYQNFKKMPRDWGNADEIQKIAIDLTMQQLKNDGHDVNRKEITGLIQEIEIKYNRELHVNLATTISLIFDQIFDQTETMYPFTSKDGRELAHIDQLREYREKGLGVVYLINHSSHLDEFLVDLLWQRMFMGLPVFAAGQNMMAIDSVAKLLMIGSYIVLRQGASKYQMSALYNYCRAISMAGAQQGIFLEAWRGGARTRDGSLRYPKRLVTLRGAIDIDRDVVVQPIALSFSAVPEDLPLSSRKSAYSWFRGLGIIKMIMNFPLHPKSFIWRCAENLYGRCYVSVPKPFLLSDLKQKHSVDKSGISLDEFVALSAIKEIARTKKIMTSQITARGLLRARRNNSKNLVESVTNEIEAITKYHVRTFQQEPDFEDFIRTHTVKEVVEDGLSMLVRRRVVKRWRKDDRGFPVVRNESALSYYATHADRRLYSPTADQNIVVAGAGTWGFALASLIGNRILDDRKYNNASLTIYDSRPDVAEHMGLNRHGPGRFSEKILPRNAFVTSDQSSAFRKASEIVIAAKPSDFEDHFRGILQVSDQPIKVMIATRGFIPDKGMIPYLSAMKILGEFQRNDVDLFTLAGPVDPENLVRSDSIMGILAGPDDGLKSLADLFDWPTVKSHFIKDPIGAQLADVMARIYAIWVNYKESSGQFKNATEIGCLMAQAAEEARDLAIVQGANPETFESGSIAWTASFTSFCLEGIMRDFGRKVGAGVKKGKDPQKMFKRINRQWISDGIVFHSLVDMREALRCARYYSLKMPVLEEIVSTFWDSSETEITN